MRSTNENVTAGILVVAETEDHPSNVALQLALEGINSHRFRVKRVGLEGSQDGLNEEPLSHPPTIGVMIPVDRDRDFFKKLAVLDFYGSREIVTVPLLISWSGRSGYAPWRLYCPQLQDHERDAFERRISVAENLSLKALLDAIFRILRRRFEPENTSTSRNSTEPFWVWSTRQTCHAYLLHCLIEAFTHGREYDLTNRLLAPLRLLAETRPLGVDVLPSPIMELVNAAVASGGLRDRFMRDVICHIYQEADHLSTPNAKSRNAGDHWFLRGSPLAEALISHFDRIASFLQEPAWRRLEECNPRLRQLPLLITEVRTIAGVTPTDPGEKDADGSSSTVVPLRRGESFRILVVDDHYTAWKGLFSQIGMSLTDAIKPGEVCFHYSEDGKTLAQPPGASLVLAEYDLIFLDIYLCKHGGGLELLAEIRERLSWIPVIVWTSSIQAELPARASLANGFLFKKTVSQNDLLDVIGRWLAVGRSQRIGSLPNPFFDHALRDPALRQAALELTKWSLSYMDCFHAVDHFYFRYFNDHGGRHILGVLDAAARLLRPFLFDAPELLSKAPEIRSKQLFCVYVALLCHEFGMFPIMDSEQPPDEAATIKDSDWSRMEHVRSLHAVRGMVMLLSGGDEGSSFRVHDLTSYMGLLDQVVQESGRAAIALLVGYHQRCLSIAPETVADYQEMQKLEAANCAPEQTKSASKTLDVAARHFRSSGGQSGQTAVDAWTDKKSVFQAAASAWRRALGKGWLWDIAGLRKLCAIVRFADALDVDHTRLPAEFLVNQRAKRRPLQDREDCKRQVLRDVGIKEGRVSLSFFAHAPSRAQEEVIVWFADEAFRRCAEACKNPPEAFSLKERSDVGNLPKETKGFQWLGTPSWLTQFFSPWPASDRPGPPGGEIEKFLNACLQAYFTWAKLTPDKPPAECLQVASALASAAAVLVVLEIEDEYRAIQEVGLERQIALKAVEWEPDERGPAILRWKDGIEKY
jgi:CheY-like chemotaxis protein